MIDKVNERSINHHTNIRRTSWLQHYTTFCNIEQRLSNNAMSMIMKLIACNGKVQYRYARMIVYLMIYISSFGVNVDNIDGEFDEVADWLDCCGSITRNQIGISFHDHLWVSISSICLQSDDTCNKSILHLWCAHHTVELDSWLHHVYSFIHTILYALYFETITCLHLVHLRSINRRLIVDCTFPFPLWCLNISEASYDR